MALVYKHIRLDTNEVFYVGIGKNKKRPYSKRDRNIIWERITKKTCYSVIIIKDNLSWEEACKEEKQLILFYGRKDLGTGTLCNMTDGGEGTLNVVVSKETRLKKSINSQKYWELNRGIARTQEVKDKISKANKGKKHTQEAKDKIAKSVTGEKNPFFGKKHTEETKLKISNYQKIRPVEISKKISEAKIDKTLYHFYNKETDITDVLTRKDFSIKYGLKTSSICAIIKGKRNSLFGWTVIKQKQEI